MRIAGSRGWHDRWRGRESDGGGCAVAQIPFIKRTGKSRSRQSGCQKSQ